MASRNAIAKIHIAHTELNISRKDYLDTLSGWTNIKTGLPVEHANELTEEQANEVIALFIRLGWKPKPGKGSKNKNKYFRIELPADRDDKYATQKQMNMLCGLWIDYSREKTEESFRKFVCNIAKIDLPVWLLKEDVQKVRKGIKELKK